MFFVCLQQMFRLISHFPLWWIIGDHLLFDRAGSSDLSRTGPRSRSNYESAPAHRGKVTEVCFHFRNHRNFLPVILSLLTNKNKRWKTGEVSEGKRCCRPAEPSDGSTVDRNMVTDGDPVPPRSLHYCLFFTFPRRPDGKIN